MICFPPLRSQPPSALSGRFRSIEGQSHLPRGGHFTALCYCGLYRHSRTASPLVKQLLCCSGVGVSMPEVRDFSENKTRCMHVWGIESRFPLLDDFQLNHRIIGVRGPYASEYIPLPMAIRCRGVHAATTAACFIQTVGITPRPFGLTHMGLRHNHEFIRSPYTAGTHDLLNLTHKLTSHVGGAEDLEVVLWREQCAILFRLAHASSVRYLPPHDLPEVSLCPPCWWRDLRLPLVCAGVGVWVRVAQPGLRCQKVNCLQCRRLCLLQ